MPARPVDTDILQRAQAAIALVRAGRVDPQLALSYVVWPSEPDDPDAGTVATERRYEAAA